MRESESRTRPVDDEGPVRGRGDRRPVPPTTLAAAFAGQVARFADRPAVRCGGRVLTYAELDRLAERLAAGLRRAGVRRGDVVALCLPRSVEMTAAVLAVLKAGAAYLPMDPAHPRARRDLMTGIAGASALMGADDDEDGEPGARGVLVTRLRDADAPAPEAREEAEKAGRQAGQEPGASPDDLAYVIFTSGSTGVPKGVEVTQRSVLNLAVGLADRLAGPIGPAPAVAAVASLSFDASVKEMLIAFTLGGSLLIATDEQRFGEPLEQHVADTGCTVLPCTPTVLRTLRPQFLPSVRTVLLGGEKAPDDLVERWLAHGKQVVNVYGPTECTVDVSLDIAAPGRPISIGRPLANIDTYVLDAGRRPVPDGEVGELYVAGACLARGYAGNPEETEERFVPDPFRHGRRMYRTGDLARWLADARLQFVSRVDDQVKIRGIRVEPSEAAAVVERHPAAGRAVVLSDRDAHGEARLICFFVPGSGAMDGEEVLREHARRHLPAAMVPAAFHRMTALPLLASGKLDRGALLAHAERQGGAGTGTRTGPAAPAGVGGDPVADRVLRVFAHVLGRAVHPGQDFFDLGGHSLLAVEAVARIREELDVKLPLNVLFKQRTAARVAQAVRELMGGARVVGP